MMKAGALIPNALIYDNACALRLHWNKVYGTKYFQRNELTEKLSNMTLVLDRFHRKGHTRPMCRKMMNPDDSQHASTFKDINTSVCEQFFSFLTKFRLSLRGFNYPTSTLFTLLLFHLKNCHTTGVSPNNFGLAHASFPAAIRPHFSGSCVFDGVVLDMERKQRRCDEEDTPIEATGSEESSEEMTSIGDTDEEPSGEEESSPQRVDQDETDSELMDDE